MCVKAPKVGALVRLYRASEPKVGETLGADKWQDVQGGHDGYVSQRGNAADAGISTHEQAFQQCDVAVPRTVGIDRLDGLQLMMPAEAAHDTVAALGHVGLLQFKDLNTDKSAFQKSYSTQV